MVRTTLLIVILVFANVVRAQENLAIPSFEPYVYNMPYGKASQLSLFNFKRQILIYEPFIYGQGADGQIGYGLRGITGNGGSLAHWSYLDKNAVGVFLCISGTTIGGYAFIRSQNQALGNLGVKQVFAVRAMVANTPSAHLIRIGLADVNSASAAVTNGIWFEMDNTGGVSTNWFAKTSKAGVQTSVDTGVSGHLLWHWFEIVFDASVAKFYIDGKLVASINVNVPSAPSELFGIIASVYTADGLDMRLRVDDMLYFVPIVDKTVN